MYSYGSTRRVDPGHDQEPIDMIARPIYAVLEREVVKMFRQRTRLVSAMVRPLIWLFVIGAGFGTVLGRAGGVDYQQFLVPGVLGMTILFGAMLAALTLVYDKESGVMRMLIIAPFAHHWIVVAKTAAAALAGLVQASLLIVVLAVLGFLSAAMNYPLLLAGVLMTCLACAGIGVLVAAFTRTLDNFAAIMNFVIFPVFFLSGALYPIENLPLALKIAAMLNPFTYGVDLLKHAMLAPLTTAAGTDLRLGLDLLATAGFTLLAVVLASWRFSREQAYEPLIHLLTGKRG
jgi:ABC-2 type transport system permease protein